MNKTMTAPSPSPRHRADDSPPQAAAEDKMADKESASASPEEGNDARPAPARRAPERRRWTYQGNAWSQVPKGTCEKTASSTSPTGFGQLAEFAGKKV